MSFFVAMNSDYNFTGMVLTPQDSSKVMSVQRNVTTTTTTTKEREKKSDDVLCQTTP